MVIVPETQRNIAEVNILNKDIGFIRKDQKAIVKIDAFPYTRYGTINGKIINIAILLLISISSFSFSKYSILLIIFLS